MVSTDSKVTDNYFNVFLLFKNYLQRSYVFSIFRKKFKIKTILIEFMHTFQLGY